MPGGALIFNIIMFYFINYPDDDIKRCAGRVDSALLLSLSQAMQHLWMGFCPRVGAGISSSGSWFSGIMLGPRTRSSGNPVWPCRSQSQSLMDMWRQVLTHAWHVICQFTCRWSFPEWLTCEMPWPSPVRYTWSIINTTLSIFVAVMSFQGVDEAWLCTGHTNPDM